MGKVCKRGLEILTMALLMAMAIPCLLVHAREEGQGEGHPQGGQGGGNIFSSSVQKVTTKIAEHPRLATAVAVGALGALTGPVAVVAVVQSLGFGSAGIAAGSSAATIMSTYGGSVVVGSACATLQSIGAAGLTAAGYATVSVASSATGSALGAAAASVISTLKGKQPEPETTTACQHACNAEDASPTSPENSKKGSDETLSSFHAPTIDSAVSGAQQQPEMRMTKAMLCQKCRAQIHAKDAAPTSPDE